MGVSPHRSPRQHRVLPTRDLRTYHQAFRAEIPKLLGPRGRLVIAVLGDQPVGVGAFKPVDDCTAEVKRMYVRPEAQGRRVGRAVLERLLTDARSAGYTDVRLETLDVMTAARALYTSLGFVETSEFPGSETAGGPLSPFMRHLHLSLTTPPARGRLVRRR